MNLIVRILKLLIWAVVALYLIFFVLVVSSFLFVSSFLISEVVEKDNVMKVRVDDDDRLDFDESARLARRFDTMVDKINDANWSPQANSGNIRDLMYEVTPMFMYEGLVTQTNSEFETIPFSFSDGFDHNHIAGRSNCETYVLLNARYQNENSGWYNRANWPVVMAHEIAHAQQGSACSREYNSQDLIENSAQVMAWEVMAALSSQGSSLATLALVCEFRGVAMSSAGALAVEEGREEDYEKLLQDVYGNEPQKMSSVTKALRFWADDMEELSTLRIRYSWTPLNMVFKARSEGTVYQLAISNDTHSVEIDDLIYFLRNAEELTEAALEREKNKSQAEN